MKGSGGGELGLNGPMSVKQFVQRIVITLLFAMLFFGMPEPVMKYSAPPNSAQARCIASGAQKPGSSYLERFTDLNEFLNIIFPQFFSDLVKEGDVIGS